MPLIHVHAPSGTFTIEERDILAEELTMLALAAEKLPTEPFDKSTTWIYFHDLTPERVYHGGRSAGTQVVAVEINCFEGGLDGEAKLSLYRTFTDRIRERAGWSADTLAPVYIIVREVQPVDWGVFGGTTRIEELRTPHPDRTPI